MEPNEFISQRAVVDSISRGSVTDFVVSEPGSGYAVNETAVFDGQGGLSAYISEIKGKGFVDVNTTTETFTDCVVTRTNENEVKLTFISTRH